MKNENLKYCAFGLALFCSMVGLAGVAAIFSRDVSATSVSFSRVIPTPTPSRKKKSTRKPPKPVEPSVRRDPNRYTVIGETDYTGPVNTNATPTAVEKDVDMPPPPAPVKKTPKMISGGVLNGKAVSLPKPEYPPAARVVKASGAINVQVVIDEGGNVIYATAVSAHPLLRAAVKAAREATFSPVLLSGTPVKVSGVIVYNFVP